MRWSSVIIWFVTSFAIVCNVYANDKSKEFILDLNILFDELRYKDTLDMVLFYEDKKPFVLEDDLESNLFFIKGVSLAVIKNYEESNSVLLGVNDFHLSDKRKLIKNETLGINNLMLGKTADAYFAFHKIINDFDESTIGGLRKKMIYLSVLVRLTSELYGFKPAEKFVEQMNTVRDKCKANGIKIFCSTVFYSSYGKLYADHGMKEEAIQALETAVFLFENNIADFKNNRNYIDVVQYLNKL
jgi:hypothetical protein